MIDTDQRGAIGFAEKVLELLDEGRYTATYKYAVLLALLDLCLEHTHSSGAPPDMVTTRQLADKIVELYWPHTLPFVGVASATVLKQNATGQADIISAIARFRACHAPDPSVPRWESRMKAPDAYEQLVRRVEWKLIAMPLPRLQIMGQSPRPFIYEIYWDQGVGQSEVAAYQRGGASPFDNRVMLRAGVGEYLLQLNGLLRPLIQRRWASMVAQLNRLEESQLEMFLFGTDRSRTAKIRTGLWEIQERRCFYCDAAIADPGRGQVDHFVPWSRFPDDALDNFVVADRRCNGLKSSSLAAAEHLARWTRRFVEGSSEYGQLAHLAKRAAWERQAHRSLNVARAIYLRLPNDARLWLRGKEFVSPDSGRIGTALNVD
ncbi:MAG: HNH endonuclease domain-containing protein [Vicinamibacterales bacterium]